MPQAGPQAATSGGFGPTLTVFLLLFGLLVLVGIGVKLYDLKRKREAEAVHLQAQVSDALLRDPTMFGLAVTPTAHVPWWSGTPACIVVSGRVPTAEARERALRIVEQEGRSLRSDVVLEDRLEVEAMERVA
ncbi:MAG: hypothetical protein DMD78_09025 [Candidatus Rokuibacteriota bacterium]|nr:MAG: hypothetical protein DMD78_09025 [Candidatus Rokubacteria bacterium]